MVSTAQRTSGGHFRSVTPHVGLDLPSMFSSILMKNYGCPFCANFFACCNPGGCF